MSEKELIFEIRKLCEQKNAIIMSHYYQVPQLQDIADFVGDSLALAQQAAKTDASIIVICGVHFMGETAKIICPDKKVLIPDMNAGCSLADSCDFNDLKKFKEEHPEHIIVSYVNTSAAVKSLTDVVVTSSNALKIVQQLPKDKPILFGPDRNLGSYINSVTGRNMDLWNGGCHVHQQFSVEKLIELKKQNSDALVLAHPECKSVILKLADHIGSTQALLQYAIKSECRKFIVATEAGILHKMQQACPEKVFIALPPETSEDGKTCACNECNFMRLNTLEKLYNCLKNETNEIIVDDKIAKAAILPINKMLEMSK